MCSRIFTSSSRYAGNSFLPVYQFDFQRWMIPTRRPPGCIFCPTNSALLRPEDHGDMARPLENLRCAATGAGAPALQRRPLVGVRGQDDEVVAVPVQVGARLRLCDRRMEHLLDVARDRA